MKTADILYGHIITLQDGDGFTQCYANTLQEESSSVKLCTVAPGEEKWFDRSEYDQAMKNAKNSEDILEQAYKDATFLGLVHLSESLLGYLTENNPDNTPLPFAARRLKKFLDTVEQYHTNASFSA